MSVARFFILSLGGFSPVGKLSLVTLFYLRLAEYTAEGGGVVARLGVHPHHPFFR